MATHLSAIATDNRISPGNDGLTALSTLVNSMRDKEQNIHDPIVLVSGFSGWGRPLFGTINYWGGFTDLPKILSDAGYTVIVVKIGPMSSNRERACEIWSQLKNIHNNTGYDQPGHDPTRIPTSYGNGHPATASGYPGAHLKLVRNPKTWQPVLFGKLNENWVWGKDHPVHFICHSQGGTSVRYLVELLSGDHEDLFPRPQFPNSNCQDWVKSIVTLGTPHKGTTVTDVVMRLLPPDFMEVLTRFIWSASFDPARSRFYDLQLDHWGFYRQQGESLGVMYHRLQILVPLWWNSEFHGFNDNSVLGVRDLGNFAPNPSPNTYYFTMSFSATDPFPDRTLSNQDINEFLALFPLKQLINPFGLGGIVAAEVLKAFSKLPFFPRLKDFATWFTGIASRHLQDIHYFSRIPKPGSQIPRPDILPLIALTGYAMGGYRMNNDSLNALGGITSDEYQCNDGIVNTKSMNGPVNARYGLGTFPGPGDDTAKGKYWYLGRNVTMDHADQVGVFTVHDTKIEVGLMYLLFADLVSRLE